MEEALERKNQEGVFPPTIYKYRLWNDVPNDHIIRKRTIRLASPSEMLADYPEAFLPIDESLINENYLQQIALHVAALQYPTQHISYQKVQAKRLRRIMKIEVPNHRKERESRTNQINDETLGIFCSTVTDEDLYLWEIFAGLSVGFSVGLDTRRIVLHPDIYGTNVDFDSIVVLQVPPTLIKTVSYLRH